MKIKLFGLANDSIVDGPGLRFAVFTQGCYHNCEGCHNPGSHDPEGGYWEDCDVIIKKIKQNPLLDGITFSGGEPFLQAEALCYIADEAKKAGLNVMVYTGYTYEEILEGANEDNKWLELLKKTDILVDGRFVLSQKSIELNFKGSSNQRLINVPESLKAGKVILSDYN